MIRPTDKCPICASQEEQIISQILKILQRQKYSKNSLIIEQGESSKGLYLIGRGTIKISKISPAGKEMILQILNSGDTFGEGVFLGQEKQANSAIALESSEVFFIPKRDLQPMLEKNASLHQSVVSTLVRWLNNLDSVIENINTPSARERVINYLSRLQKEQGSLSLTLGAKKYDLALMLGLRPETFSRCLTDLESEGHIKMDHKQIELLPSFQQLSASAF